MITGYVYVVFADNGYEFDNPQHEDSVVGVYTDEVYAQLALYDNGFQDRDNAGNYWRGRELAWIEKHELHDSYVSGMER